MKPLRAIQTTTGPERERGYSGVSAKRKRIDTLGIGETFTLAGFSFRVESKLPPTKPKAGTSNYDPTAGYEKGRNYPDLAYVVGLLGRKIKEGKKGRSDRSENRDHGMTQREMF
ncbi:hypothetical protein EBR66_08790 [bacterium]|nr:hypothetical protein [bacterium]